MSVEVLKQLVTPMAYLRIKSGRNQKLWVDLWYPLFIAALATMAWVNWPQLLPFRGGDGMLTGVGSFMQVLVGFYVAGLAAVATFPRRSLDQHMVNITLDGKPLERRRFLSYMFGYLAMLSLTMLVAHILRGVPVALVQSMGGASPVAYVRVALFFVYQFIFWQMILVSLLGIHFLAHKIHVD